MGGIGPIGLIGAIGTAAASRLMSLELFAMCLLLAGKGCPPYGCTRVQRYLVIFVQVGDVELLPSSRMAPPALTTTGALIAATGWTCWGSDHPFSMRGSRLGICVTTSYRPTSLTPTVTGLASKSGPRYVFTPSSEARPIMKGCVATCTDACTCAGFSASTILSTNLRFTFSTWLWTKTVIRCARLS